MSLTERYKVKMDSDKISISISAGRIATVWDVNHAMELIQELRIPGNLVGSLPRKPWQNQVKAIPLMLIPEEVTLLVRKGHAVLSSCEIGSSQLSSGDIDMFRTLRETSHTEQIKLFLKAKEEKKKLHEEKREKVVKNQAGKTNKLQEHIKDESKEENTFSKDKRQGLSLDFSNVNDYLDKKDATRESSNTVAENLEITDLDRKYYEKSTLVHMPTILDRKLPMESVNFENKTMDIWDYPKTSKEKCDFAVYCNLWEKGYYLTAGGKFGCDYLCYPGEPARYHSHFIVIVKHSSEVISSMELLSYGRLGSGVKKTVVFAIVNEKDNFSVSYQSVSWAGITQCLP